MRQSGEDRARYYRQLRDTIQHLLLPELTSAQAVDAVGLVDRILAEFIVEEEAASSVSTEFGTAFEELLRPGDRAEPQDVSPARFHELWAQAAETVAGTVGSSDAGTRALGRRLVEVEREFLERVDELRNAVLAEDQSDGRAPSADRCSVTEEQMTDYFRGRLSDSPGLVVESLSVVPGGRSKETILVSLTGTRELPRQVIVRKDRPVGLLQTRAADEYAVIKAVHDFGGVPVPEPFFAECDDPAMGDGTFLVMERVRGHKAGEFFPDLAAPLEHRLEIGLQLAAALARLHSLPLDRLAHTSLDPNRAPVTDESVVGAIEGIIGRIHELTGPPCATVPLARQWLLEHVSDVVPAPRLCLLQQDFGFHNMLVDGAAVTALVDWEAAAIGPPARELAAAWSPVSTLMPWPAFVDVYIDAGGHPEDTDVPAISFYRVLAALGGFMTSRMGGHMFRTGAKRDLQTAHSGLDSQFRCERNLARALFDAI